MKKINKNLVALLRYEWPSETCKTLSLVSSAVRDLQSPADNDDNDAKSQLLLGALSNLTAHLEDFNEFDED